MALPVYAAATLAELKAYAPISGTAKDSFLESELGRWTLEIEAALDRRLVFRAPTEDADNIVASTTAASGSLTVLGDPSAARCIVVVLGSGITGGTLTVTGTVDGAAGTTEEFDLSLGASRQYGVKFFTAVSAASISGLTGSGTISLGTTQGYVEYHSVPVCKHSVTPLDFPVRQVAAVAEDTQGDGTFSTTLTDGTDYDLVGRVKIRRLSGGAPWGAWQSGDRSVRVTYSAGYQGAANVPGDIKSVLLELVAWSWRYSQHSQFGATQGSDSTGSWTSGPPMLTKGMKDRLGSHRAHGFGAATGQRDFDAEAV